jgi:hypothetical protein
LAYKDLSLRHIDAELRGQALQVRSSDPPEVAAQVIEEPTNTLEYAKSPPVTSVYQKDRMSNSVPEYMT